MALANTQYMDRYVFAGTGYDIQPFDANYAYQASADLMQDHVSPITEVVTGMVGSSISGQCRYLSNPSRSVYCAYRTETMMGFETLDGLSAGIDQISESRGDHWNKHAIGD